MSWWQAILAYVIGPTIAVVGSVAVARRAGRSSDKAAETTAHVAREANAIDGFDRLARRLEQQVGELTAKVGQLSGRIGELEHEVAQLRDERRANRALIRRLWARLQVALAEIRRLHGNIPPDPHNDEERVALILEAEFPPPSSP